MRVVSLVPSLTELVWALAPHVLVGRTRFCLEPEAVRLTPAVGGTKNPDVSGIAAMLPDLVIANREENRREDVEALRMAGLEVLVTDPNTVEQAMGVVVEIATRLGVAERGWEIANQTAATLGAPLPESKPRVFVAVWHEPLMGLGSQSYGHDLIERCGALNVLAGRPRYPEVTLQELADLAPELILLPDEPYPFKERHLDVYRTVASARVIDGKLLWWYGPRMAESMHILRRMFSEAGR
ncbi:MAG: ABC transporter substrate-binding protein [Dehalococcoidia bacterium]|nr:ABC transporter substrate-binding protein [Dehalococcoidia bacterium]